MTKATALYANNVHSTLNGSITNSATSILLNSTSGFPTPVLSTDYFLVTIDDGTNVEIVKVTGISGNTLTGCTRGQEGTTPYAFATGATVEQRLTAGEISAFARLQDRMGTVSSIEVLSSPANSDANSYLSVATDVRSNPIVALANGSIWSLLNYPTVVAINTVGSGATTTSVNYGGIGAILTSSGLSHAYVIQFTTGTYAGQMRFVTGCAPNVLYFNALPTPPSSGDYYEVLSCVDINYNNIGSGLSSTLNFTSVSVPTYYGTPIFTSAGGAVTGPITLPGNAISALQAVPLQQLTAAIAGITGYTPPAPITFTPDLFFNGTNPGMTYASRIGNAYQIGKMVHYWVFIQLSNLGSAVGGGQVILNTLPVAIGNFPCVLSVDQMTGMAQHPSGMLVGGSTTIQLRSYDGSGSEASLLSPSNFTNTTQLYVHGSYITS